MKRGHLLLVVIASVLAWLVPVSGTAAIVWSHYHQPAAAPTAAIASRSVVETVPQASSALRSRSVNTQAVAANVSAAVVDINTTIATLGQSGTAAGTGMIVTSNGLILTNNHVVKAATGIEVVIPGHAASYTATVVGVDPTDDVALLKVNGLSGLPTVTLADSSTLSVGEAVVAVGNALGRGGAPSVTQGAIDALDQAITASDGSGGSEQLSGLIEMNASISPGDSGGALVNSAGQVVGMITAGQSSSPRQTSTTVGYAITASTAVGIVEQMLAGRSSSTILLGPTGYLGVAVTDVTSTAANRLGLSVTSGALVVGVGSGSPAESAGISRYAVITGIGSTAIASAADLGPAIQSHKPGDQLQVTWVDGAGSHTSTVTLTTGPVA